MTAPAPSTSTPAPLPAALTPEDAASLLELSEKPEPVEPAPAVDTAPLPEPEPTTDDPDAEPAPAPDLHEVTLDDGTVEKVPLDELKRGYYRRSKYDRAVTKAKQEQKAFEDSRAKEQAEIKAARDAYAAKLERMDQALNELTPGEPDWDKIRQESPDQFATAVAEWSVIKEKRQKLATERQRIAEEQAKEQASAFHVKLAEEAEKLAEVIPELKDEKKAPALKERLLAEGEHRGFSRAEVAQTTDHRLVAILHDAMKYRELLAQKDKLQQPKAPPGAPTAVPPGTRPAPQPKGLKDAKAAYDRLKETGSVKDAARILESLGL